MAEEKRPFKELVNDALRRGLAPEPKMRAKKPFRVIARSLGFRPGVDVNRLNQLVDELDAREYTARARKRGSINPARSA